MKAIKKLKNILKCNLLKTIVFNVKMLPLRQAAKLPILFFGKVSFRSLNGKAIIKGPVYTGMIKIGVKDEYVDTSRSETIWTINGTIKFSGPVKFCRGSYVLVAKGAELKIGTSGVFIGAHLKILCFDRIEIGNCVRVAWECQLYDSSFHYVQTGPDDSVKPLPKPVIIGDRVWVGNRCTISKGAVIPNDTIIAAGSMVNKDFSESSSFNMLAGVPAKVKATGLSRVWDLKKQAEYDRQFNYHRTYL